MLISQMKPEALSREQITKVVFGVESEVDDGTQLADIIFVFGGKNLDRVWKAVELYNDGRAPYILFAGGDRFGEWDQPEATMMRDEAVKMGVPPESIFIETMSNHTKENVIASLIVLDRALGLQQIQRLLFVSAPSHMRRCQLLLKTFMPPWYEFVWSPDHRAKGRRDNWWIEPVEVKRAMGELHKVISGVKGRYFMDAEIDI
ncbi:YdcF family protein [Paenibacillus glucanolyticus]|uniref:YdcF family protein n=1 Tax=Paenibacillus glucanolyticus TaxID=59843 RepID=UPI0034CEF04F